MSSQGKKKLLGVFGLLALLVGGFAYWFATPDFHAQKARVERSAQLHLGSIRTDSPTTAALEYLQWNIPASDRIQMRQIHRSTQKNLGNSMHRVKIAYGSYDDSYHTMFYDITLNKDTDTWSVSKIQQCWKGRGLFGWSTKTPS